VNLLEDPRYAAERWMAENVAPGDTIEVYGNNVYLPRFPTQARVVRVGPEPIEERSPLPNVTEVVGAYADAPARGATWIVVSDGWVWRYTLPWEVFEQAGLPMSNVQRAAEADRASRAFFGALHENRGGWHRAFTSQFVSRYWPRVVIHASTSCEIRIFRRDA
jgi:hypothetical protein